MLLRNAVTFLFIIGLSLSANAQMRFLENGHQWNASVLFRTDIPGGKFYVESDRFTYNMYDTETVNAVFAAHSGSTNPMPMPQKLKAHSWQVIFEGANISVLPFGKKPFTTSYNYFLGNDTSLWSTDLSAFAEITYPNLYDSIDVKVVGKGNLKYDFIVHPGGDPGAIRLRYEGVKPVAIPSGEIRIKTSFGDVVESKPFAYQMIDDEMIVVDCEYRVSKNEVGFSLGMYNKEYTLIIDPELIFSTYSGSFSDNFGYTATSDFEGHLYAGSTAFGVSYPVTTGAYQLAWAGGLGAGSLAGTDIALSKFSLDGTELLYSTYLGGSGDELPHSLVADGNNNLYMLGTTGSPDFPITSGAYQTDFNGGQPTILGGVGIDFNLGADMVVCRLNAAGSALLGSTFVGGDQNDGTNTDDSLKFNYADEVRGEIELDADGNILVGSSTFSADFPVTPNAFQATKNAGQEGVLFKLDPFATTLLASSFYGGSSGDAIYSIDLQSDGSVMVSGGTRSPDLAIAMDAFQPEYGGGRSDGFIASFDANFTTEIASTYYGSEFYDQIYFVERDDDGHPHIFGQTRATGSTFISNAEYSVPNSGMLLAKLNESLTEVIWSTVFGNGNTRPNLSPTAFSVDICNRIYLSGWGGNVGGGGQGLTTGLEVTDDALKPTTNGGDFYFMVLASDASELIFASFFGGNQSNEHVDGGTSRFDRSGTIYQAVCAGCGSNDDFPIQPANALSPTNNSTNCNLGVAKIDFDLPLIIADFETASACLPDSVYFTDLSDIYTGSNAFYQWDFGDGTASAFESPAHLYENPGIYTIRLIITDPGACNASDTLTQTLEVFSELKLILPDSVISCDQNPVGLLADSEGSAFLFTWSASSDFSAPIQSGAEDSLLVYSGVPAWIYIRVENGLCSLTDSLFAAPAPSISLSSPDTLLCEIQEFTISVEISDGHGLTSLIWAPEEEIISGQGSPSILINADAPIGLSVSATTSLGCQLEETIQIDVYPIFLATSPDTLICLEDPLTLVASSMGLAETFQWSTGSDFLDQLNNPGDSTISVLPTALTYYYILVENNGCILIDSVAVSLLSAGTSIGSDQYICQSDTAFLFVSNDFPGNQLTHFWTPENLIFSGQGTAFAQAVVSEITTFNVVSSTPQGCTVENSTTIFTSSLGAESIDAFADPTVVVAGGSSQISVVPINPLYFYQWNPATYLENPNMAQTTSTPAETITYTVTVSDFDPLGVCAKSDSVTIQVFESICGMPNVFVPNAFSPNGDGENDQLFVRGGSITSLDFTIFDRWGNQMFATADLNKGWDGTYKNNLAEPAVYVYYLNVRCDDGQDFFSKGNITLIR